MNDVMVMFLAFIATYFVFMYFAYRLAKVFFPTVDYQVNYNEEIETTLPSNERVKKRIITRR